MIEQRSRKFLVDAVADGLELTVCFASFAGRVTFLHGRHPTSRQISL